MYLLEHDAKELIELSGISVPQGRLMESPSEIPSNLPGGPWVIKAQISAGGRGKAGLIKKVAERDEIAAIAQHMWGATLNGRAVHSGLHSVVSASRCGSASEAIRSKVCDMPI